MERLSKEIIDAEKRPVKVLQFGEGNFLRAFTDYMFDICNEKGLFDGSIVIVKPRQGGSLETFKEQDNLFTVSLRGRVNGEPSVTNRVVTCAFDSIEAHKDYEKLVEYACLDSLRYVVSNTTEAGIVFDGLDSFEACPPKAFPAKVAKLLYERFKAFNGDTSKGLVFLPVELIDDNGPELKYCIEKYIELWQLPKAFKEWIDDSCIFCSTLVDRIVSGYPSNALEICEELGYEDRLLVAAEPFASWIIQSPKDISGELAFDKAGLPVVYTDNYRPYKQRKVRILNGAHTSFVLASYLCGNNIVRESMEDKLIKDFMNETLFDEVIPTLDLPKQELLDFAKEVIDRFNNPYVDHALLAISLNSVSKWKARCLPSFTEYIKRTGKTPCHLAFSIAALMAFYSSSNLDGNVLIGKRNGEEYIIKDDLEVLEFFRDNSGLDTASFVKNFLSQESFFGMNLCTLGDTFKMVCDYLEDIRTYGMRAAMEKNF